VSSLIDPAFVHRLRRLRMNARSGHATGGVGVRRSQGIGPGIEFAEYRDFQHGDDVRHIDRHVLARHGRNVVRLATLDQRMHVTVLLDATASMRVGDPPKFQRAAEATAALAAIGLFGGDLLAVGAFSGSGVEWMRALDGARRLGDVFSWLASLEPSGLTDLETVARTSVPLLKRNGVLVVISDWMLEGVEAAVHTWSAAQQDVVAIQVLAHEEIDPALEVDGSFSLVDAETGDSLDVAGHGETLSRYRAAFASWQSELRGIIASHDGRWSSSSNQTNVEQLVMRDWRRQGIIS